MGEILGPIGSGTPAQRSIRASISDHDVVIIDRRFEFCNGPLSEKRRDFSLDLLLA
jgi:hypothetical protein